MPPELFTQNMAGLNYSNARTILMLFYDVCRVRQQFHIDHVCQPIYEAVMSEAVARGLIVAPGFDRRRDDFLKAAWIPRGWNWVDPLKEAKGKETELNGLMETLTDIAAGKGKDIDDVISTRARELAAIQRAEERYGVRFPTGQPQQAGKEEPEDDE
jgi:capsid protein